MLSWVMLIVLSMINSLALTLTVWAALQLKHTDWWVVFLVIFIIGLDYQVEMMRRYIINNTGNNNAQDHDSLEIELEDLARPPLARVRSTRGPGTARRQTNAPPRGSPVAMAS